MATVYTSHRGNLAIEQDNWKLPVDEAKKLLTWMKAEGIGARKGGTWDHFVVKPIRSAIRRTQEQVRLYTAGFVSGEFSNFLHNAGIPVQILPDAQ